MTDIPQLKPCPFCGGADGVEQQGDNRQSHIIACQECGCRLETGETWNAGDRWNTRIPPKVKPLVFEDRGILECTAVVSFGTYHVHWDDEVQSWYASLELGEHENPIILEPSDCASDHDAKTVAQADYKRRILEALE